MKIEFETDINDDQEAGKFKLPMGSPAETCNNGSITEFSCAIITITAAEAADVSRKRDQFKEKLKQLEVELIKFGENV